MILDLIVVSGWLVVGVAAAWSVRKRKREREAAEAMALRQEINREGR